MEIIIRQECYPIKLQCLNKTNTLLIHLLFIYADRFDKILKKKTLDMKLISSKTSTSKINTKKRS